MYRPGCLDQPGKPLFTNRWKTGVPAVCPMVPRGSRRHCTRPSIQHEPPGRLCIARGVAIALACRHDGALHQHVPDLSKPVRPREIGIARELAHDLANFQQMRGCRPMLATTARKFEQYVDEEAPLKIASPEPIVKNIEYQRQAFDRRAGSPLNFRLEPAASPKCFTKIECGNREIGLRFEVFIQSRLGIARLRKNGVDSDSSNAVSDEQAVSDLDEVVSDAGTSGLFGAVGHKEFSIAC